MLIHPNVFLVDLKSPIIVRMKAMIEKLTPKVVNVSTGAEGAIDKPRARIRYTPIIFNRSDNKLR